MNALSLFDSRPTGSAVFSPCERYRYHLTRVVNQDRPGRVVFAMLNPSTATAEEDDPTIRRCMGYTERWGFGELEVVNIFAWRATDPSDMKAAADPVGPDNDAAILAAAGRASLLVAAWGAHGAHLGRSSAVRRMLEEHRHWPLALGLTAAGEPRHPLYLKGDLQPRALPRVGT